MNLQTVSIFLRGSINDWYALPLIAAAGIISVVASQWRFLIQWLRSIRGGDWPTMTAIIDIVSIVEQRGGKGNEIIGYLATLTYFYRNPELQTGEYSRMFQQEEEAQAWAASYKGSTVTIHVDPRDPSRSVLRKQEL
jgi:hypothetical protein